MNININHYKQVQWSLVGLSFSCLFALGFLDNIRGPAFPTILEDYKLPMALSGWIFAMTSFFNFASSFSCQWLLKKFSSKQIIKFGLLIMIIGISIMGLSPNMSSFLFGSAILGIGQGLTAVSQHIMIQESSHPSKWRKLFAGLHSTYGLASFFSPLYYLTCITVKDDWRFALVTSAILPIFIFLIANLVKEKPMNPITGSDLVLEKTKNIQKNNKNLNIYIVTSLFLSFYLMCELSLSTRLVLYLQSSNTIITKSNYILSGFFILLFLGRFLLFLFPNNKFLPIKFMQFCLGLSIVISFVAWFRFDWMWIFCGLLFAPIFPLYAEWLSLHFANDSKKITSISLSFGTMSVVFMHVSFGWLSSLIGIKMIILLSPISASIAFLLTVIMKKLEN